MRLLRKLFADVTGGTFVEYAFILTVIAVGSLAGVKGLGEAVGNSYSNTASAVREATP